jgi:hypothetical protein
MSLGPDDLLEPGDEELDEPLYQRRVSWVARVAAVLVVAGLVGASIAVLVGGGDDDRVAMDPQVDGLLTAADLAGRTFVVVAMEREGRTLPLAAEPPALAFGDSRLQLRTGCNGMEGDFGVVGDDLLFFGGGMDLKGCAGTTGAQEQAVLELFLDTRTQPVEQRIHPDAHLVGDVLQLRLRDLAAWAVDVTEQASVGAVTAGSASEALASSVEGPATFGVTPSAGIGEPWPVVTVVDEPADDGTRRARAFVVTPGDAPRVEDTTLEPAQGATVAPGDRIAYAGVPVEGGAVAHVNGVEVPVDVDHDALATSFLVPTWARGEITVTLSLATPEGTTATAAWYRVG